MNAPEYDLNIDDANNTNLKPVKNSVVTLVQDIPTLPDSISAHAKNTEENSTGSDRQDNSSSKQSDTYQSLNPTQSVSEPQEPEFYPTDPAEQQPQPEYCQIPQQIEMPELEEDSDEG